MADKDSWSMARLASRRPLPKERKLHPTTVGKDAYNGYSFTCRGCGYHVCSCPSKPATAATYRYTMASVAEELAPTRRCSRCNCEMGRATECFCGY